MLLFQIKINDAKILISGNESLGMIFPTKGEMVSSENISSTNEVSIIPIHQNKQFTSTPKSHHQQQQQQHQYQHNGSVIIHPNIRHSNNMSRSSQSTPSPTTTTANITAETSTENVHLDPIIKMEVPDDDDDDGCMEPKTCENGNFNYVGEYIAAELNKLPLRDAFMLKNILIREVLTFTERAMLDREKQ